MSGWSGVRALPLPLPRLPGRRGLASGLFVLLAMLLAAVVGLVVSTGNFFLIAIIVSPLFGMLLLANWRLCFWGVLFGFLVINGPLQQFAPQYGKLSWAFSGLSLLLMLLGIAQLMAPPKADLWPRSPLAWWVLAGLVVVVAGSAIGSGRTGELLAGFKRYFQTWGVFFAFAVLPLVERDLRRVLKLLTAVAVLHLPFVLYQYFFVLKRFSGAGALDVVVGIFEGGAEGGGGSGVMSLYLVLFVAVTVRLWLAERIGLGCFLLGLTVFGAPLAMGETKAVVLVLPIVLLLAAQQHFGKVRTWAILFVLGVMTIALGAYYVSLNEVNGANFDRAFQKILAYNVGSVGYDGSAASLNRASVISFWWQQHGLANPVELLFGHGLGASYFANSALAPGHLFVQYPFMNINLTAISTILWDGGLLGLSLYLSFFFAGWRALRQGIVAAGTGSWHAEVFRATEMSLLICLLSLPYNNAIISFGSQGIWFAVTMGICAYAWRWRAARMASAAPTQSSRN